MAGDALEPMPMSPQSARGIVGAVIQWLRSRRGRVIALTAVFMLVFATATGVRHSQSLSSSYQSLSSSISTNYHLPSWRPHLPNLPSIIGSPLKTSNTTRELENGELKTVPQQLNKKTANFHLLMPSLRDDDDFCKTSLSAMLLNYPPPTIINMFQTFPSQLEREKARLKSVLEYLDNKKLVNDEDLVLVVDGHDTWFQLPSDVMIRQYKGLIAESNRRLLQQYGYNAQNVQKFNETIIFGAEKKCEGEDLACRHAPESILPENIYGAVTEPGEIVHTRARFLDAGNVMGPAKDMRRLYDAAVKNFNAENSQAGTGQSVLSTMLGEQELARQSQRGPVKSKTSKWFDWFVDGTIGRPKSNAAEEEVKVNTTIEDPSRQYEFSIGLDYTHTLFQPLVYAADDELVALPHDNTTDLSAFERPNTPTATLSRIPNALLSAKPPFWTPDLSKNNPSPNAKSAFIEPLAINKDLDKLKRRETTWSEIDLLQNTYTGAIPAAFHLNLAPQTLKGPDKRDSDADPRLPDVRANEVPRANINWTELWYAPYARALLRKYFRTPMSPIGYHNVAVGGDRMWDMRGGRGGVWTEKDNMWLPWGEIDGVCGTLDQLKKAFGDGKGVWLHEKDSGAEQERLKVEKEMKERIAEAKKKAAEKAKEQKEKEDKEKAEAESKKQKEQAEKEKQEAAQTTDEEKLEEETGVEQGKQTEQTGDEQTKQPEQKGDAQKEQKAAAETTDKEKIEEETGNEPEGVNTGAKAGTKKEGRRWIA
ncbi:hypothetical protein BDV96DRAFT_573517 [Lophiotrema nucula]|uniref:Uncharacterized protein n=1 Tax=Lophiotrema nucula TaxID=690887 RepID=A0A6A5ZBA3_9PLEO|nr:hypothetical protein BDV96DRAFT_573517 [Lophiotrema nucula]